MFMWYTIAWPLRVSTRDGGSGMITADYWSSRLHYARIWWYHAATKLSFLGGWKSTSASTGKNWRSSYVSNRVSLLSGIVSISDLAAFITVISASYWLTTAGQLLHNGRSIAWFNDFTWTGCLIQELALITNLDKASWWCCSWLVRAFSVNQTVGIDWPMTAALKYLRFVP